MIQIKCSRIALKPNVSLFHFRFYEITMYDFETKTVLKSNKILTKSKIKV